MAVKTRRGPKKHKPKPRTPEVKPAKSKAKKPAEEKTNPNAPSPDPTADHEALQLIAQAERELAKCESEYASAKVEAREAKAAAEKRRKKLFEVINEATGKTATLFAPKTMAAAKADASAAAFGPESTDESWRDAKLDSLNLPDGILKALATVHITTVGEHADYMKPQSNGFEPRLTDIKGIGKGAVDKIDAALEQFWTERKSAQEANRADAKKIIEEIADNAGLNVTKVEMGEGGTTIGVEPSLNGDGHSEDDESDE